MAADEPLGGLVVRFLDAYIGRRKLEAALPSCSRLGQRQVAVQLQSHCEEIKEGRGVAVSPPTHGRASWAYRLAGARLTA